MGIQDDLVHFTTESGGKVVYSVTWLDNISDVAVIWKSERDMLEWMALGEMEEIEKKEEEWDGLDYWDDDEGEDKIVLE